MATDERDRLSAFALRVWGYKQGEVVSLMIHLGDRLVFTVGDGSRGSDDGGRACGRYRVAGAPSALQLRGQAAAGLIGTGDGEVFEMSAEAVAVLAEERRSLWFAGRRVPWRRLSAGGGERLAALSFGIGLTQAHPGPAAAHAVERMTEPWTRLARSGPAAWTA